MFEYLYEWIRNIAFYMILSTVLLEALPVSEYKKYIRFFMGMILVLLLMMPIWKVFGTAQFLESVFDSSVYEKEVERMEEVSKKLREVDVNDYMEEVREKQYESENRVEVTVE